MEAAVLGGGEGQEDQVARERRKYVKNCITTALKEHPTMNIREVRRGVNVKTLRTGEIGTRPCHIRDEAKPIAQTTAVIAIIRAIVMLSPRGWGPLPAGSQIKQAGSTSGNQKITPHLGPISF